MAKTRTLESINQEYSYTCGMLGDRLFRVQQLQAEAERLKINLTNLDKEAEKAKKESDKTAAALSEAGEPVGEGQTSPNPEEVPPHAPADTNIAGEART